MSKFLPTADRQRSNEVQIPNFKSKVFDIETFGIHLTLGI
jgi:hypothetical protein